MSAPQMTVAIDDGGRTATAHVPSQATTIGLRGDSEQELMTRVFTQATEEARTARRTIRVSVTGVDTAPMYLEVDPDNTMRTVSAPPRAEQPARTSVETPRRDQPRPPVKRTPVVQVSASDPAPSGDRGQQANAEIEPEGEHNGRPPQPTREFDRGGNVGHNSWATEPVPTLRPRPVNSAPASAGPGAQEPARIGLRGRLNAILNLGLAPKAGSAETRQRIAGATVARPIPGFSIVTVANTKGGAGKSPIAAALNEEIATYRGPGSSVCVDVSDVGGTLPKRAVISPPDGQDVNALIDAAAHGTIVPAMLSQFLTRQPRGGDILVGSSGDSGAAFSYDEAAEVGRILSDHREILIADTGNSRVAGGWRWATDHADVLLVPMPLRLDVDVLKMLKFLKARHGAAILDRTIVLITDGPGDAPVVEVPEVENLKELGVHRFARMPYEPKFASGGPIALPQLLPATATALTVLAAMVVDLIAQPAH
ncbi:ParA family protein [Rhodococcus erythropolis]|uniref:ParA family protein n=1 Tax=Rhodococcus TaxID=1827 RepID=UPI001AE5BC43|nr:MULTISPECIES: ParA family protein [Rhodococcus]MBP2520967.1 MinD-like ATPase involved in chromosome partitioning or flagellar assembly [Rhodococcus sp. PvP104]MBY6382562.1 ParA family protein [Rhodococcus erythropolis]MBY6389566.1 ParA family protein [Rhodococcus erythropolis]